jgi:hypothetical protein
MKVDCTFLPVFYEHHRSIKAGVPPEDISEYAAVENIWMGFFGLGNLETYRFIYEECTRIEDLEAWMIRLKGASQIREAAAAFERWRKGEAVSFQADGRPLLSETQGQHWKEQGYLKVSGLVSEALCDAVTGRICRQLGVDLSRPETWYNPHPDWHGLMVHLYQDACIDAIKTLPAIRQLFAELYGSSRLIANADKVSYNPPETATWTFRHQKLHWDIDFAQPDPQYIQGLVYLNDVPENRGPLQVVPGFHHRFGDWLQAYPDPHNAHQEMQRTLTGTPVPGQKGDVVLWLQALPHAASANHSDLPRFVQYVNFSRY